MVVSCCIAARVHAFPLTAILVSHGALAVDRQVSVLVYLKGNPLNEAGVPTLSRFVPVLHHLPYAELAVHNVDESMILAVDATKILSRDLLRTYVHYKHSAAVVCVPSKLGHRCAVL